MIFISCYIVLPVLAALITTLLLLMNDKQKKDEAVQLDAIDTSNYIVMDIKDNDNVYVDKIVTLPQTYISIENQIEQLINERYKDSGFIKSSNIYFNDAVLSRYISQDGSQLSILGYVQDSQIYLVDIDSNIDEGIGEINSNLDRGLNAVYKTEYANKIVEYLEIMGDQTKTVDKYSYHNEISNYFTAVGEDSGYNMSKITNFEQASQIKTNAIRFGCSSYESGDFDRIFIQLEVSDKSGGPDRMVNIILKLNNDYMIYDVNIV